MDIGIKIRSVIILLSFHCLSIISGINIDCNGRAFYCVNSTHFKICVDLGGGVSKTIDDFLLPCPYNTYCRETNKYECEYYETTTPSTMITDELSVINDLVEPSVIPLSHTAQMLQVKSFGNEPASLQDHASEHEELSALDILVTSTQYITDNEEINNVKNTNFSTTQLLENVKTQAFKNEALKANNMVQNEVKIKHEDRHGATEDSELETSTMAIDFVTNLPEKDDLNSFNTNNNDTISATITNGSNNTINIKSKLSINKTDEIKTIGSVTVYTTPPTINQDDKKIFKSTTEEYLPNGNNLTSLTTEQYKFALKTVIADSNNNTNVDSNIPKNFTDVMISGGSDLANTIFTTSNYDSIELLKNTTKENILDYEHLKSLITKNYKNVPESKIINGELKYSQNKTDGIQTKKGDVSYIVTTTSKYNERQLLHNTTLEYFPDNNVTVTVDGDSIDTVNVESIHTKSNTDVIKSEETDSAHTMSTVLNYDIKRFLQNTTKQYFSDDAILKSLTTEDYNVVLDKMADINSNNTTNMSTKLPKNSYDIMQPIESDTIHKMSTTSSNESTQFLQNATKVYLPDEDHLKFSNTENHKNATVTFISDKYNTKNVDSKIQKYQTDVLKSTESDTTHLLDDNGFNSLTTENHENISKSVVESNKTVNIQSKHYVNQDVIKTVESDSSPTSKTTHYDDKQSLPNPTKEYLSDDGYSLTTENYENILETITGSNFTINDFQSKPTNNTDTRTSEILTYTMSIFLNYDDKKIIQNSTKEYISSDDKLLQSSTTDNYKKGSEAPIIESDDTINVDSNIQANSTDKMIFSRNASKILKLEHNDKQLLQNTTQEYLPEPLESKYHGTSLVKEITSKGNYTLQVKYPIISTTEQIKINYETENVIGEISSTKSYNSSFSLSHSTTTERVLMTTANIDLPYSTELSKTQLNNTNIIFDWHNSPFSILGPQATSDGYNLSARKNIISTTKTYDENKEKTIPISQLNVDKQNSVSEQMVTNVHATNENNELTNHYEKLNSSLHKNINIDKNETNINIRENPLNLMSSLSSDHPNPYNNNVLERTTENYKQVKFMNVRPDTQIISKDYILNSDTSIYVINTTTVKLQSKNKEYLTTAVSDNLTTISMAEYNLTSISSTENTLRENLPYVTDFETHSSNSNVTPDPINVENILLTNKYINETTTLLTSKTKPYSADNYFWPRTTQTNDKYLQNESTLIKTTPIEETTNRIYISNNTTKTSQITLEPKEHLQNVMTVPNNVTKLLDERTSYYKTFTPKLTKQIPLLTVNENAIFNDSFTHSMKDFATTTSDHLITPGLSLNTSSVTETVIDSKNTSQKLIIEATPYTYDPVSEKSFVYNKEEFVSQNLKNISSNVTSNNDKYSTVLTDNVQGKSDNKSRLTFNESPFSQQFTKDQTLEFKDPARFYSTNQTNSSFLELNKNIKALIVTRDGLIYNKSQDNNNSNDLHNTNNNKINNKGKVNLGTTFAPLISLNSTQIRINNQTQGLLLKILSGELSNSKVYYVNTLISYCQNQPAGKYADKNDCKKFYVCLGEVQSFIGECPNGTVFSESKKQCTKNLSQCYRNNQFKCISPGRYYDLHIKNVYYICLKNKGNFLKFKYQCQNGYSLNKIIIQCVKDSPNASTATSEDLSNTKEESTSISLESSSKISTESKIKETKSETEEEEEHKDKKFECKKEGKFPHPKECNKYYLCSKTKKSEFRRKLKSCESHEVFDKDKHKCIDSESSSEC